ncbi:MAG: hypothetical protein JXR97_07115 [Planctomycetes bacterium]|nr:hypothetical protein [Planctomycetota bacterium]
MSSNIPDIPAFDADNLFRQETYTDLKIGSIQVLVPVKSDGSKDESRATMYIGSTQIMSQSGPIPVQADIEAESLAEAIEKFPEAAKDSIQKMIEHAQEMEKKMRSQIVVPEGGSAAGSGLHIP